MMPETERPACALQERVGGTETIISFLINLKEALGYDIFLYLYHHIM